LVEEEQQGRLGNEEGDSRKLAISVENGLFEWVSNPFSLRNLDLKIAKG
jgi:hypothetical protein